MTMKQCMRCLRTLRDTCFVPMSSSGVTADVCAACLLKKDSSDSGIGSGSESDSDNSSVVVLGEWDPTDVDGSHMTGVSRRDLKRRLPSPPKWSKLIARRKHMAPKEVSAPRV